MVPRKALETVLSWDCPGSSFSPLLVSPWLFRFFYPSRRCYYSRNFILVERNFIPEGTPVQSHLKHTASFPVGEAGLEQQQLTSVVVLTDCTPG